MISCKELRELDACESGYNTFVSAHGEEATGISIVDALKSNGIGDLCWYLEETEQDYSCLDDVLREFARKQALINIEKIEPYCSADDYGLIVHWLNTGDESIKSAAGSAAESAAWSAARSAAAAARLAARSAARSVVVAARLAARSAAESATWSAAELTAESAARSAAGSAAWSAARSAAESAAQTMLIQMLERLL